MENYEFLNEIEQKLGYKFKNEDLLLQAFVRKSFSSENSRWKNNEVLEFVGDKALDVIIVAFLNERYNSTMDLDDLDEINQMHEESGYPMIHAWFESFKTEGELTKIKISLVESKRLASVTEKLGFHKYLFMGKGDIKNSVEEQAHVKEDLYEAIIGAVAIDSGWDFSSIKEVIYRTLNPEAILNSGDFGFDYTGWAKAWWKENYNEVPDDVFKINDMEVFYINRSASFKYDGCDYTVVGYGWTEAEAVSDMSWKIYDTVIGRNEAYKSISSIIGEPSVDKAVNQLQELWQKGKINQPKYNFTDNGDLSGDNWECICSIPGTYIEYRTGGDNKTEAKKNAAYEVLLDIIRSNFGQLTEDVSWN